MKEKYLLAIKNAMFWHFSSSEIKDVIGDLNMNFESAMQDGASEQEVLEQYGTPGIFVKELVRHPDPVERKRKLSVLIKIALLAVTISGMMVSAVIYPSVISGCLFVISVSAFIWFLAGNNCIIGIIKMTKEKKSFFWRSQAAINLFFLVIQLYAAVVMPYFLERGIAPSVISGQHIRIIIYICLFLLFMAAVFFTGKMLRGNVYMFFGTVQITSIIYGLVSYYAYLENIDDPASGNVFVFTPYLVCIAVLPVYWVYIQRIRKGRGGSDGCTN